MAHRLHCTAMYLLVALGLVHAGLAPVFYDELTPNTVWFDGAGLALVLLGLLNASAALAGVGRVWLMCRVANVVASPSGPSPSSPCPSRKRTSGSFSWRRSP